ncbi:MAG: cobalt-precorrin-5B (C(1))-methyltransferase [Methanospirillum sp.]|nr:cobalt-precorrin-5B (C(1))-methyltransferase [Methanospirillum sp.]
MIDPVSGFCYPASWISACTSVEAREAVKVGLAVLTADGTIRKRGFTTGTTAAAASKAAVLSIKSQITGTVTIMTPVGIRVSVEAQGVNGHGISQKYSGDYPGDVTAGITFHASATPVANGIEITCGEGIGIWKRKNPRYQIGSPAISPPALSEIQNAITEAITEVGIPGAHVIISAENGKAIATHTLNAKIGVEEGISVLGSTGFVEPWDDHLEETVMERVSSAQKVVLTTGRIGLMHARLLFPTHEVILVGSRLGHALPIAKGEVIICGLPALILKYINPKFLDDSGYDSIEEMIGTDEFDHRSDESLSHFCEQHPGVHIVLLSREGSIIKEAP